MIGLAQFGQEPFGGSPYDSPNPRISRVFATNYFGVESQMAANLWRLGEASGSLYDSIAELTGTPHGTVNRVAGLLPGDSDGAVQIPNGPGPDYIDCGQSTLALAVGTAPFSIAFVIQPSALDGTNRRILSTETGANIGIGVYCVSGFTGFIRGTAGGYEDCHWSSSLVTTAPTHVVCTYDGTAMHIYINSVLRGTVASSTRSLAAMNNVRVGNRGDGTNQGFKGTLDELMVSSFALTQTQVTALYAAYGLRQAATLISKPVRIQTGSQSQTVAMTKTESPKHASQSQTVGKSTSLSRTFAPTYVPLLKQLTDGSLWSLDETAGSYGDQVGAISGTAHTVTRGAAGLLPGGGGDPNDLAATMSAGGAYIDFGVNYGFAGTAPFSFVIVHKPSTVDATYRRVVSAETTYNKGWAFLSSNEEALFLRGDAVGHDSATGVPLVAGQTYLIVGTYDGTKMGLFINGVLVTGNVTEVDLGRYVASTRSLAAQTQPLALGNTVFSLGGGPAPGTYDYFAICQYALSAAQVSALWGAFNQGQGQLATLSASFPALALPVAQAQSVTRVPAPSSVKVLAQSSAVTYGGALARGYTAAQGSAVTRGGSMPQTRSLAQSQSLGATAAPARRFSATQGQSFGRQGAIGRLLALAQAAGAALRQGLGRTVTVTQTETVVPVGGGPSTVTFALTQGAVLTRQGAITATRALAQDQDAKRLAALNVIVAQTAGAAFRRSVSRWLAKTQPQTATRRATVSTLLVATQAGGVGVRGVVNAVRPKQAPSVISLKRSLARGLVGQQGTVLRVSRNIPRVKTSTQAETLVTVRATARSTFTFASGQIVVLWGALRILAVTQDQTIVLRRGLTGTYVVAQGQNPIYAPRLKRGRITVTDRSPHAVATISGTRLATSVQGTRISVEAS